MNSSLTIALRELRSFLLSPIGYVVAVIFLAFNGYTFGVYILKPGAEASLRPFFNGVLPLGMLIIIPMLTMRLISEEFRSGTIETLMTTPISDAAVVAGKFIGTFAFFVLLVLTTIPYLVAVTLYGDPDWGGVWVGYMGVLLMGALYIAIGLFFSACTSNQIIAVICSFSVLAVLAALMPGIVPHVHDTLRIVLQHLSIGHQFGEFVQGTISLSSVTFFVTTTSVMLFAATKVLESRRWR